MAIRSFRGDIGARPEQYRTPSPPRKFYEYFARSTINGFGASSSAPLGKELSRGGMDRVGYGDINPRRVSSSGGLDAFAAIALATKSNHNASPTEHHQYCAHTQSTEQAQYGERPSKRARSERLPSPEASRPTIRPTTSYNPVVEPQASDAELLLNFSREACFAVPPSHSRHGSFSATVIRRRDDAVVNGYKLDSRGVETGTKQAGGPIVVDGPDNQELPKDSTISDDKEYNGQAERGSSSHMYQIKSSPGKIAASTFAGISKTDEASTAKSRQSSPGLGHSIPGPIDTDRIMPNGSQFDQTRDHVGHNGDAISRSKPPSICAECNSVRSIATAETENGATSWISCDGCKSWFHFACAGFKNEREVRAVDKYRCQKCKPIYGPTTYVRKSLRAHNAIDYAGLHEGVLKTSDDNPEHHYIQPIKDGIIKFNPETFARMRPELVTTEFFERGDGMKEPIVIPAAFNPRPEAYPGSPDDMVLPNTSLVSSENEFDEQAAELPSFDTSVLENWLAQDFAYEVVPDIGQDALGMVMPPGLTVRRVCELYGPDQPVEVIDVKSQNGEDRKWNMRRWADYYESRGSKIVRNVISLEVSHSMLGRLIQRPKLVRDMDLQDAVWPPEMLAKGDHPKVQFYCLMSVADCFTDFHIDFGGSSVFYHILKGRKTFFFIPPTEKHLKKYEEWCNSRAQNWTFLGDQTKECYRVDLYEGDTALIPAGWIHAVWTPEDSLVIGGNFLTRTNYAMQIRVTQIEKATGVTRKFRYPHFQKLMWYAAIKYLEEDPIPDSVEETLLAGQVFPRDEPVWLDFDNSSRYESRDSGHYNARFYSKAEVEGLPELARYLQRTALIASGNITDGISVETRNAVRRSIPRSHLHGEPIDVVKKFAIWHTWKEGNITIPHWAYPDYVPEVNAPEVIQKKLSAAAMRRLDREAALQAEKQAPQRQSARAKAQAEAAAVKEALEQSQKEVDDANAVQTIPINLTPCVPRRPACESCRKRRRACKHREEPESTTTPRNGRFVPGQYPMDFSEYYTSSPFSDTSYFTPLQAEIATVMANFHGSADVDSHSPMTNYPLAGPHLINHTPAQISSSSNTRPSGRSKACQDCRRSKRRCIHDENGKEDPIKMAEAAIPRPFAKKRRLDGEMPPNPIKGFKSFSEDMMVGEPTYPLQMQPAAPMGTTNIDPSLTLAMDHTRREEQDVPIDPALFADFQQSPPSQLAKSDKFEQLSSTIEHMDFSSPPVAQHGEVMTTNKNETSFADTNLVVIVDATAHEKHANSIPVNSALQIKQEIGTVPEEGTADRVQHTTSLVSPPDSTNTELTDNEKSPREEPQRKRGTPPSTTTGSSRRSSRTTKQAERYTPESGTARRASTASSNFNAIRDVRSPDVLLAEKTPSRRKESRLSSDFAADEESLKLIKSLQAEDLGLRRRTRA